MSHLLRLLSVIVLSAVFVASAWSYPTLFGDTGLVQVPSATVIPETYSQLGINFLEAGPVSGGTVFAVRLNYGLAEQTELFLLYLKDATSLFDLEALGGGLKIAIIEEDIHTNTPGLAAGVRIVTLEDGLEGDIFEGYLAASKVLRARGDLEHEGSILRAHGGVSYTQYSNGHSANFVSPFVGLSYASTNGNSVVIDYVLEHEDNGTLYRDSTVSAAIRRHVTNDFWLELGATKGFAQDETSYYAGLMYHYGERTLFDQVRHIFYY